MSPGLVLNGSSEEAFLGDRYTALLVDMALVQIRSQWTWQCSGVVAYSESGLPTSLVWSRFQTLLQQHTFLHRVPNSLLRKSPSLHFARGTGLSFCQWQEPSPFPSAFWTRRFHTVLLRHSGFAVVSGFPPRGHHPMFSIPGECLGDVEWPRILWDPFSHFSFVLLSFSCCSYVWPQRFFPSDASRCLTRAPWQSSCKGNPGRKLVIVRGNLRTAWINVIGYQSKIRCCFYWDAPLCF